MDDALEAPPAPRLPRWAIWSILFGTTVVALSVAGLIWLPEPSSASDAAASVTAAPGFGLPFATPTPPLAAAIQRLVIAPASPTTEPTIAQAGPGAAPTAAPAAPSGTRPPPPVINWTQQEKYALTWLCWYEVRGMGYNKVDACLSVISTVRARYAYNSGFGVHDVISTINAPGQFTGVKLDLTRPAPDADLLPTVEQYVAGARGTCNGYLYYDSMPGGPMTCVIYGPGGQWEEFHN